MLHVSVRDRGGRYITGLTREAFTVIDDARPQTLEMFSAEEVPASVGFLIDNSNSMRPSRERVVASAVAFAEKRASSRRDLRADVQRSGAGRRGRRPSSPTWTPPRLHPRCRSAIVARGMTAVYDGIASGLSRLERARHTRQVLIVVSDGGDNASRSTLEDTLQRVRNPTR